MGMKPRVKPKLRAAVIRLSRSIWYRVEEDDAIPASIDLGGTAKLVHPLLAAKLVPSDLIAGLALNFWGFGIRWNKSLVFNTDLVVVIFSSESYEHATVVGALTEFFRRLRFLSKQAALPPEIDSATTFEPIVATLNGLSPIEEFKEFTQGECWTGSYHLDTSVRTKHLLAAAGSPVAPSIYAEVLLDAIRAFHEYDYRKTILYAAIAIESAANEVLDQAHNQALHDRPPHLRVVSIPTNGGAVTTKDPVWNMLSRGNFPTLLHEKALYLQSRSLLLENPSLYKDARKLYSSRNKLAHGDQPGPDLLDFTKEDAHFSIDCARRVLGWLGVDGDYPADSKTVHIRKEPPS